MKKGITGFTIVELLIVIVVIAILATISIVAFNGIQVRARDAKRTQDITAIAKGLEAYYAVNGRYPTASCTPTPGSCVMNTGWSTTNDTNASWENLKSILVPTYMSSLPSESNPTMGVAPTSAAGRGYAYYANNSPTINLYCGVTAAYQMYILVYTLESGTQNQVSKGDCNTNPLGPYAGKSMYRTAVGGS